MLLVFPCGRTPIRVTLPINHLPWGVSNSQSLLGAGHGFLGSTCWQRECTLLWAATCTGAGPFVGGLRLSSRVWQLMIAKLCRLLPGTSQWLDSQRRWVFQWSADSYVYLSIGSVFKQGSEDWYLLIFLISIPTAFSWELRNRLRVERMLVGPRHMHGFGLRGPLGQGPVL